MDAYNAWSLVFSGLSAVGTLVAAGGAIFAIAQIRKHWRDDDTVATIFADDQRLNKIGKRPIWTCQLRVVNSGKVNFSVKEVAFCDERLNESFKFDTRPISERCNCPACRNYSRAYIRHLLKVDEMLGMRLCVLHNLYFYNELMAKIREAIDEGRYESFYRQYRVILGERVPQ